MKYYNELLNLRCFTLEDVYKIIPNKRTAKNTLTRYIKQGFIERVKRNYYVVIDIVNAIPLPNKYVIASSLDESTYIAYHSALNYYGYQNQVMNEITYCGNRRFNDFIYNDISYHYVSSKCNLQIEHKQDGSVVTSLERSIIDCIDQMELSGSIEEIYKALALIPFLDEEYLREILDFYNKKVLYQRTGYILSTFKNSLRLSDEFFSYLRSKSGNSVCYLISSKNKRNNIFNREWQVCIPVYMDQILTKGGSDIEI